MTRVRCIACNGERVRTEERPLAMYSGRPTRIVLGTCPRCGGTGLMPPATALSDDAKTQASGSETR